MTVEQYFSEEKIERQHLELIAETSDYWAKASRFILQNWTYEIRHLTIAQAKWAGDILDAMTEMRIEKRGVFYE